MKLKTTLFFILTFIFLQGVSYGDWYDAQQKGRQDRINRENAELKKQNAAIDRQRRIAAENKAAAHQRKMRELELEISRLKLQQTQKKNKDLLNIEPVSQQDMDLKYTTGWDFYNLKAYTKAVIWWKKAAKLGHREAQTNLGWMYAQGLGVDKDMLLSKYWTDRAIQKGSEQAQTNWDELELWKY